MEQRFATIKERKALLKVLIDEERPDSLLRVMKKSPLYLYLRFDHDIVNNKVRMVTLSVLTKDAPDPRNGFIYWSDYDGFNELDWPSSRKACIEANGINAQRWRNILKLANWPCKVTINVDEE